MAEFEKINAQELENAAGGQAGAANIKHVANIQSGYLAVRTAPEAKYENEIKSTKLYNLRMGIRTEDRRFRICKRIFPEVITIK